MEQPTMMEAYALTPKVDVLPAYFPVPGLGLIPVNAFLLHAAEPVLVDTGLVATSDAFMDALRARIDLTELRYIWLTHVDLDHVGSLERLLEEAPNARVVTTFLGLGKRATLRPLPNERVVLLNPGQTLRVGDRDLQAFRPPTYDAPETTGFIDRSSRLLFTSDSFGAVLSEPVRLAMDMAPSALEEGLVLWTTIDAPWLHDIVPERFEERLRAVAAMEPTMILSSHLPPASGMTRVLLGHLRKACTAKPFVGFDQPTFARMLASAPG